MVTSVSSIKEAFPVSARVSCRPHTPMSILGSVGEGLKVALGFVATWYLVLGSSQGSSEWGSSEETRWCWGFVDQ